MRRYHAFILFLGTLTILWGCSGHEAVVKELESYTPPALYQAAKVLPEPHKYTEVSPQDNAFEAQIEKLRAIQKEWERALSMPAKTDAFYTPDPIRLNALSRAFVDDKATQAVLSDGFSLEDLEILVWGRNAMIKNAEKKFRATLEAYNQASILDDIIRSYSAFNAQIMTGVGNMEDMESIYKKFPFPGILSLKGNIVSQEVKIARQDLEIARRTAITEVRRKYWDLLYNKQAKEITSQTLNLLESFETSVARRYATGQSQIRELTRVQIQREKMKEDLTTISEEGLNIEKRLQSLLLLPAAVKVGTPAKRDPDKTVPFPDNLVEIALKRRQELEKIRIMVARMELMIEMAETEIYPGFSQNYTLSENRAINQAGTMKTEEPFSAIVTASVGAGLPKAPWTGLFDAYLIETRQRLDALLAELKGAEAEIAAIVRESWFAADLAKRELSLYSTRIAELSRLNFKVAIKAYESGAIPFSEIIDAIMFMLETGLSAERRKTDLGIALADLYETIGVSRGQW